MKRFFGKRLLLAIAVLTCLAAAMNALAQSYPSRPVRMVIPYAPGGPTDIIARLLSIKLGALLGQQVIVDNRPGAAGNIASQVVATAAPEGYTLLLGGFVLALNPSLYKSLPFNVNKDFTPIGMVAIAPLVLVVHPEVNARNVAELIAIARAKPGSLSYGSAATGDTTYLGPELFKAAHSLDILSVSYKGAGPALNDLVGGRLSFMLVGIAASKSFIESGKLRPLAVTGKKRAIVLPDVPTFAEVGAPLPDMDLGSWWGLLGPAGLPREVVKKLNDALARALLQSDIRERFLSLTIEPTTSSPEEFSALMKEETDRWARVAERLKIVPE